MLVTLVLLIFLLAVVRGFVRTVAYFWDWLSDGRRLGKEQVERAEEALEESEDVLERELACAASARGLGRLFVRWRASREAVDEYLDHLHLGWYQLVIIFFVGCMAGLLIEEVWMLATAGLTENRVGLVWGPFSPLYGFGAVLITVLCFGLRRRGARLWQVFLCAALVGGALEQVTGWSMETFLDATSWTYESYPDHITKWVAVRFLVYWGILGIVWCKVIMPRMLYQIGMPTTQRQAVFVTLVALYLVADIAMTLVCFNRKAQRDAGIPPANSFEQWVDTHYSDDFIAGRFQNLQIGAEQDELPAAGEGAEQDEAPAAGEGARVAGSTGAALRPASTGVPR